MPLRAIRPTVKALTRKMNAELNRRIKHIEGLTDLHLSEAMEMLKADNGKIFGVDLLGAAALKRSMALCESFASMVRAQNYTTAASLLRLQLDTCLRFFSVFLVDEPHSVAAQMLRGTPIRRLKDRKNNYMTDRYLVDTLGHKYEWMPRVYNATSGFVHLSERHIHTIFGSRDVERSLNLRISATDEEIPNELWIELADGFLAATDALFEYIKSWTYTKKNPGLVEQLRDEHSC